jgi:hypothetical protein
LKRVSQGLTPEVMVALFPENWRFKNKIKLENDDRVFYFNNKFVDRFFKYSIPILSQCTEKNSFSSLRNIDRKKVRELVTLWTWMHEHHHHEGALPLPESLPYKNDRSSAAFEELRVDMGAISNLSKIKWMNNEEKKSAMEFILCERLLRYPIQNPPSESYDAIGSQMIFQFLKKHSYIQTKGHLLSLKPDWVNGVTQFSEELHRLNLEASQMTPEEGKKYLGSYSKSTGNYSATTRTYLLLPYYAECRDILGSLIQRSGTLNKKSA